MNRVEFVCGIGFGQDGQALDKVEERLAECRTLLVNQWCAFTELDGQGHWRGQREAVKAFVVYTDSGAKVAQTIARRLAAALNQQCVAVAVQPLAHFNLVGAA